MFEQAERLQETVLGRLFVVTIFPLLVFLFLVALTLFYFLVTPILMSAGAVLHGRIDHYTRYL